MKQVLFFCAVLSIASLAYALDGDTFTVNCAALTIQRSDPIISAPNTPGSHTHSVIGGNAFSRSMAGKFSATNATATTCDKAIDHSNYWVPSLYHQRSDKQFELVPWNLAAVYYQKRACNYAANIQYCDKSVVPLAFPDGFRMVAGDPARRTQNNTNFAEKAVSMMCIFDGGSKEGNGFPPMKCNTIRAQVYFPSCWDGVNLDSANHMSHVAYPEKGDYNGGVCPKSHPVALLSIFFEFFFDVSAYNDINRFAFACADPTGYGFHGDFIMGWTDRNKLQNAHKNCVSASDCPDLGNQPRNPQTLIHPAVYEEEVGLHGPIPKLPGNNPVVFPN